VMLGLNALRVSEAWETNAEDLAVERCHGILRITGKRATSQPRSRSFPGRPERSTWPSVNVTRDRSHRRDPHG